MNDDDFTEDVSDPCPEGRGVTIDDFVAYMPTGVYIFTPCREPWVGKSVDARLAPMPVLNKRGQPKRISGKLVTIPATRWLNQNRAVEQMTWAPGFPMLIKDRLVVKGGWIERPDVTTFNHYRPPRLKLGNAVKAGPWLEHLRKVYPDDASHLAAWLAHRVQRPGEKINHALVLGGLQGIGKDTLLEPVKYAVGPWNFQEVSPARLIGRFNEFVKSVILRVSEARDLGDAADRVNRFTFYDSTKTYIVTPPDVVRIDEKHLREYNVVNVLGLIITTNYRTDAIYLPADDRRHYATWSNLTKDDFPADYWNKLWGWYYAGGFEHVAAYLTELDISAFDPKAPPPKTPAFWDIVSANVAPEDAELADVIDALKNPDVLIIKQLVAAATGATAEWLTERKNRRTIPHRLERCGYIAVKNPKAKDGLWKFAGARQVIYAKASLSFAETVQVMDKFLLEISTNG